ncbi:MAG: thioredoxin domain-containing protein [Planctomycetota bacterium]|nr:thioredoxin domain-containing protein [Planctomycetota bacterium]
MHSFNDRFTSLLCGHLLLAFVLGIAQCKAEEATQKHERKPIPSPDEIKKLPEDGGKEFNRLVFERSPYLLQHAGNPVDWYPWGKAAFEKAKKENKPIFLSVGYSACHWCHVMERESFETEEVGAALNEFFVCIKVDREERPDVDDIYMSATQLITQRGGWPNSVFLMPDGRPFYAGTYFPKKHFLMLVANVGKVWKEKKEAISEDAQRLTDAIRQQSQVKSEPSALKPDLLREAVLQFERSFDPIEGGFGGAPKFPPSMTLQVILREHSRSKDPKQLQMVEHTLKKMAGGGMYDQVGGGFHRYSVDAQWLVPHFEKMLYDNALLSSIYLDAYQVTKNPLYRRIAVEIFEWVLREMKDSETGGFYSALDADSEGEEGLFYIWSKDQIEKILGEDAVFIIDHYGVTEGGNFEGHNILNVVMPIEQAAKKHGLSFEQAEARREACKQKLMEVRVKREWPFLDDKVLTAWNSLMIRSFVKGYQVLGEKRYLAAAERAMKFVMEKQRKGDRLLVTYRKGESKLNAYLDDYAYTIDALIGLYEATFKLEYMDSAIALNEALLKHFWDEKEAGFYFTSDDHEELITRSKKPYEGAIPSGNSVAVWNMLRLAFFTDNKGYREKAERTLKSFSEMMGYSPRGFTTMICAADFYLSTPKEIALVGKLNSEGVDELLSTVHDLYIPNKIIAFIDPDMENAKELQKRFPLLAEKSLSDGKATAYVCQNYACKLPVTDAAALKKQLKD